MGLSAIPTCMLVLGVQCFLLLLFRARLRSLAPFGDSIDSFRSETHSTEVVCYGYVSPACFGHLGCCGFEVKSEQFLDQLTICEGTDEMEWDISFLFFICLEGASFGKGPQMIYQFIWDLSSLNSNIFRLLYLASLRHSMVKLRC